MVWCFGKENVECTFCNIKGYAGTRVVKETDDLIAFKDRSPSAEMHLLIIPKDHIGTVKNLHDNHVPLLNKIIELGTELLKEQGYDPNNDSQVRLGFHVPPFNSVNHLHMHVIGLPFKSAFRGWKYKIGSIWYADARNVLERLADGMSPV